MNKESVFINHLLYDEPELVPEKDWKIVLVSKKSFGPLEIWEWGIDNNIPYERYEWLEDDWFEDSSYRKNITNQELLKVIQSEMQNFIDNQLPEWSSIYEGVIDRLSAGNIELLDVRTDKLN